MLFFSRLGLLLPVLLVAVVLIALVAFASSERRGGQSAGSAFDVYLFSVIFVALFVALFALFGSASALSRLAFSEPESEGCVEGPGYVSCGPEARPPVRPEAVPPALPPAGRSRPSFRAPYRSPPLSPSERFDSDRPYLRQTVQAGFVGLIAALVLAFHVRPVRARVRDPSFTESSRRAYTFYLYAVCFVAVLIALLAGAGAAFGLFRAVAPGTVSIIPDVDSERDEGLIQLVSQGFLTLAAAGIFAFHWRKAQSLRMPATDASAAREAGEPGAG